MKVVRRGILGAAIAALALACSSGGEAAGGVRQVSQEEMSASSRDSSVLVLDVRTADEFGRAHVPGAVNIPIDQLTRRMPELDPRRQIVVYCESGRRAGAALEILSEAGFANLAHLDGDMAAWRSAGLPVAP